STLSDLQHCSVPFFSVRWRFALLKHVPPLSTPSRHVTALACFSSGSVAQSAVISRLSNRTRRPGLAEEVPPPRRTAPGTCLDRREERERRTPLSPQQQ